MCTVLLSQKLKKRNQTWMDLSVICLVILLLSIHGYGTPSTEELMNVQQTTLHGSTVPVLHPFCAYRFQTKSTAFLITLCTQRMLRKAVDLDYYFFSTATDFRIVEWKFFFMRNLNLISQNATRGARVFSVIALKG